MGKFSFDETNFHKYVNDFDTYTAAMWTVTSTQAGSGSSSQALTNVDGGCLLVTNDNADDDNVFMQKVGEGFTFESGKALFFEARFKISDVTQSDFVMGLQITDTSPLAVSDGLWFGSDDGDAYLDFHCAGASTQTDVTNIATLVNDTFVTLGAYYDGSSSYIDLFVNDDKVSRCAITNAPLSTRTLTVSFGLQNGEAVIKTMTLDYIAVVKQRDSEIFYR